MGRLMLAREWIETPIGVLDVEATDRGIRAVAIGRPRRGARTATRASARPCSGVLGKASDLLRRYASGEAVDLAEIPLDLDPAVATPFRRKVWAALRRIPRGQVRTYGDLAGSIGNPGASRAVGLACGANPVPLIVPCHRVVAASGLGGFGGGLDLKMALLEIEGVLVGKPGRGKPTRGAKRGRSARR